MPKPESIDLPTRRRIGAYLRREWTRYETQQKQDGSEAKREEFAKILGIHAGTLSNLLSGNTEPGFDVGLKLNRRRGLDAQVLFNTDPEAKWFEGIAGKHGGARSTRKTAAIPAAPGQTRADTNAAPDMTRADEILANQRRGVQQKSDELRQTAKIRSRKNLG